MTERRDEETKSRLELGWSEFWFSLTFLWPGYWPSKYTFEFAEQLARHPAVGDKETDSFRSNKGNISVSRGIQYKAFSSIMFMKYLN